MKRRMVYQHYDDDGLPMPTGWCDLIRRDVVDHAVMERGYVDGPYTEEMTLFMPHREIRA